MLHSRNRLSACAILVYRRPSGIDKEFFVQLFVEPDKNQPDINTQRLLCKMFQEQNITFVEVRILQWQNKFLLIYIYVCACILVSHKTIITNASLWKEV